MYLTTLVMLFNITHYANNNFIHLRYTLQVGATSLMGHVEQPPICTGYLYMKIICKNCGKEAERKVGHVNFARKLNKNIFCSKKCTHESQKRIDIPITQEYVKSLFDYKDGCLIWKDHIYYGNIRESRIAGHETKTYWQVCLNTKTVHLHRIIFLWHYGWLPGIVDHADRNKKNNYIENLRAATKSQNQQNKTSTRNSYSQYLGVSITKAERNLKKPWRASITPNLKRFHLGLFRTEEEAALAYNRAAVFHYKEFASINIIKPK